MTTGSVTPPPVPPVPPPIAPPPISLPFGTHRWLSIFQLFLTLVAFLALVYVAHLLVTSTNRIDSTVGIAAVTGLLIAAIFGTRTALVLTQYSEAMAERAQNSARMIDALKLSEQNLRFMLDHSNIAFILLDRDFRVIAWNADAAELSQAWFKVELSKGLNILPYAQLGAAWERGLHDCMQNGTTHYEDIKIPDYQTGKPIYLHWSHNPVYDADGNIVGVCSMTRNQTQQKELEAYAREQEMLFSELADHLSLAYWIYDVRARRYLFISPHYEHLYGVGVDEMYADPHAYQRRIHPDDLEARQIASRRAYEENIPFDARYRIIMDDGSIRWIWARSYAIPNENGIRERDIGIAEDITALVEARERVREQDLIFREITEHTSLAFWVRDLTRDGEYVYFSPSYERLFQHTPKNQHDDVGAYRKRIHPDDLATELESYRRYQDENIPYEVRYRIVLDDGSIRWIWARVVRLYNAHGIPTRSLGFAEDITALKEGEERAVELALERQRSALLTSFIQSVSHEFRTPLATIHTGLHLLKMTTDPSRRAERIDGIEEQANRIMRLVEDMVTLTRLENDASLMKEMIDIAPLIAHVVQMYQKEAEAKGIRLSASIPQPVPIMRAAPEELTRALRYLMSNAVRFTEAGGSIRVTVCNEGSMLRIDIADTGIGMDEETLRHAFEQFYRGDLAQSTSGSGLGLPVANRVVELHGGTLTAVSEPGVGSTFTVRLPVVSGGQPQIRYSDG